MDAYLVWFFFFSSRRRHTRFDCDWSSDVCSSDLRAAKCCAARSTMANLCSSAQSTRTSGVDTVAGRSASRRESGPPSSATYRSEEHTSELQSQSNLVCRLLLEKKKNKINTQSVSRHENTTY